MGRHGEPTRLPGSVTAASGEARGLGLHAAQIPKALPRELSATGTSGSRFCLEGRSGQDMSRAAKAESGGRGREMPFSQRAKGEVSIGKGPGAGKHKGSGIHEEAHLSDTVCEGQASGLGWPWPWIEDFRVSQSMREPLLRR